MIKSASTQTVSESLGHFVADTPWKLLPDAVRHEVKRSLLNYIGGAIAVARDPAIEAAIGVTGRFSSSSEAQIFGRRERMDAASASFVNAVTANLLDFDDTHLRTVIHPTAPVAPVVLALAERDRLGGQDVLLALALGMEIECRLGNSVMPGHYARGWHITATCGVFGAAVAAAKLMRLPPIKTAHAIGIAASQSGSIVENLPTAAKNVGVGNAARNGLLCALFADAGYEAAPLAIEGKLGWARAMGDEPNIEEITGELGSRWEVLKNTYKSYPSGIVMHAVIEACFALRQRHALSASDVESVVVSGDALLLARGDRIVNNERDARVSIHHAAAVVFLWGAAGIPEFAEARAMSAEAKAFRTRVRADLDAGLPVGAARVRLTTTNGETFEETVTAPRGSLQRPLTDDDLAAKVRDLVTFAGTGLDAERIIEAVWSLDRAADLSAFVSAVALVRD